MTGPVVSPLVGAPFGARISGLEPASISDEQRDQVWRSYREAHGLLCFDFGRLLSIEELHALTSVFGENEFAPGRIVGYGKGLADGEQPRTVEEQVAELRAQGKDPYVTHLGNLDPRTGETMTIDEKFFGEWEWHTDMSYIEVPPTFSLLHGRQIPTDGGDTWFCSQVMAAAELPPALRREAERIQIKHDSTYGSSGILRPGMREPAGPIEAIGHVHPALRLVPTTGEEALFLGRRTNAYVVGAELLESEALLDELWAHATDERFCYRHRWTSGDVVVWDNRMLLHKREPFDPGQVRDMWRTQTKGERVMAAAPSQTGSRR